MVLGVLHARPRPEAAEAAEAAGAAEAAEEPEGSRPVLESLVGAAAVEGTVVGGRVVEVRAA